MLQLLLCYSRQPTAEKPNQNGETKAEIWMANAKRMKLNTGNETQKTRSRKPETRSRKAEAGNRKLKTESRKRIAKNKSRKQEVLKPFSVFGFWFSRLGFQFFQLVSLCQRPASNFRFLVLVFGRRL